MAHDSNEATDKRNKRTDEIARCKRGIKAVITKKVVMTVPIRTSVIETGDKWVCNLRVTNYGKRRPGRPGKLCGKDPAGGESVPSLGRMICTVIPVLRVTL